MTFDSTAGLYQQARPDYPAALYEALIAATGLTVGDRLLEIGCATGKGLFADECGVSTTRRGAG